MSTRERVSDAIWKVMHGYDGRLLEGDFYPGHEAIVEAALSALEATSPPSDTSCAEKPGVGE